MNCTTEGCPGFGEALRQCGNPDHDTVEDRSATYFHAQRHGHGPKRRGRPRTYCSPACARWVDDHFSAVTEDGRWQRKVRVWTVPSPEAPAPLGPGDWTATDDSTVKTYSRAQSRVRQLLVNGFLDCDPGCTLPGHYNLPVRLGGRDWLGHQAPAPDGKGSFGEYLGRVFLQPRAEEAFMPLRMPTQGDAEAGGDYYDVYDPAATDEDGPPASIATRIVRLLPAHVVRFLVSKRPMPAKAVAMVRLLAQQDAEVHELYLAIIATFPGYAEARATTAELNRLVESGEFPRLQ